MDLATNSLCPGFNPSLDSTVYNTSAFYARALCTQSLCAHPLYMLDVDPLDQWGCKLC